MLHLIPAPSGTVQLCEGVCPLPETISAELGGFAPWCLEALEARLHRAVRPAQAGERP